MSICKSILFGTAENYNVCGFPVQFTEESSKRNRVTHVFAESLKTITLSRAYILVHELGHSLAIKFFTPEYTPKIFIHSESGSTTLPDSYENLPTWKKVVILTAGPVARIACAMLQLAFVIRCIALSIYIPWAAAAFLTFINFCAVLQELHYTLQATYSKDEGDFGLIRKLGIKPLALASAVVLGQSAVGLYASFHLIGKLV